jgi:hypothetical protein
MIHQRLSSEASLTSSFSSTQVLFAEQLGRVWEESMGYFLHCLLQNPARVFLYMMPIENESLTRIAFLSCQYIELTPAVMKSSAYLLHITGEKLYMIAVSTVNRRGSLGGVDVQLGGEKVLHCTWDVEFF